MLHLEIDSSHRNLGRYQIRQNPLNTLSNLLKYCKFLMTACSAKLNSDSLYSDDSFDVNRRIEGDWGLIGDLVDERYQINSKIGDGGMATVYIATDTRLARKVAIKIMHPYLTSNSSLRKRFHREARTLSDHIHPNILRIYDTSKENSDLLWIVTEHLTGQNLMEFIKSHHERALNPLLALLMAEQVLEALDYAHKKGIFHRDIKPENIFVEANGQVKLMDFGIAKIKGNDELTVSGAFLGSPSYMSPEQIEGHSIDQRVDLYSLSVTLYECFTGHLPFSGKDAAQTINKILEGHYLPPIELAPWLPSALNFMIIKGLSKDQSKRYQNASQFRDIIRKNLNKFRLSHASAELKKFASNKHIYETHLNNLLPLQQNQQHGTKLQSKVVNSNSGVQNFSLPQKSLTKNRTGGDPNQTEILPKPHSWNSSKSGSDQARDNQWFPYLMSSIGLTILMAITIAGFFQIRYSLLEMEDDLVTGAMASSKLLRYDSTGDLQKQHHQLSHANTHTFTQGPTVLKIYAKSYPGILIIEEESTKSQLRMKVTQATTQAHLMPGSYILKYKTKDRSQLQKLSVEEKKKSLPPSLF